MNTSINKSLTMMWPSSNIYADKVEQSRTISSPKPTSSYVAERRECSELYDLDSNCCCPKDIISRLLIDADVAGLNDHEEVAELRGATCVSCYSLESLSALIAQVKWFKDKVFGN